MDSTTDRASRFRGIRTAPRTRRSHAVRSCWTKNTPASQAIETRAVRVPPGMVEGSAARIRRVREQSRQRANSDRRRVPAPTALREGLLQRHLDGCDSRGPDPRRGATTCTPNHRVVARRRGLPVITSGPNQRQPSPKYEKYGPRGNGGPQSCIGPNVFAGTQSKNPSFGYFPDCQVRFPKGAVPRPPATRGRRTRPPARSQRHVSGGATAAATVETARKLNAKTAIIRGTVVALAGHWVLVVGC